MRKRESHPDKTKDNDKTNLHTEREIRSNDRKPDPKRQKPNSSQDSANNNKIISHYNLRNTESNCEKNEKTGQEESYTSKGELKSSDSMENLNKPEIELESMVEKGENQHENQEKIENKDNNEDLYEPYSTYNANIFERINLADFEAFGKPLESETTLPIANISRLMREVLPNNAKIAKQAKDMIRECVTEFIFFVSSQGKDLKDVFKKYFYVFTKSCYVTSGDDLIKWDFLGPFFISILYSLSVYRPWRKENINEYNNGFVLFFLLLWIGPIFCGINASYFGCYVHWLSVVSVTMYLMLPMCVGSVFSQMVPLVYRALFMLPSFLYSCLSEFEEV
nr:nuclear transcription factor Y subunit B-8 [Theileria orientalis]